MPNVALQWATTSFTCDVAGDTELLGGEALSAGDSSLTIEVDESLVLEEASGLANPGVAPTAATPPSATEGSVHLDRHEVCSSCATKWARRQLGATLMRGQCGATLTATRFAACKAMGEGSMHPGRHLVCSTCDTGGGANFGTVSTCR
jgi:hypothetical protein